MVDTDELLFIWDQGRADFFYPVLSPPKIVSSGQGIWVAPTKDWASYIDMHKYQTYFNPSCLRHFKDWKNGAWNIFTHELIHYVYIPFDEKTASHMVMSALEFAKQMKLNTSSLNIEQALTVCCNLHFDYIDDTYRLSRFYDRIVQAMKELVQSMQAEMFSRNEAQSKVWQTFVRGYELLWDVDFGLSLKDKELEDSALEIELLLKRDWENKNLWENQVSRIVEIFLPLMDEDTKQGKKMFSQMKEQMQGNPTIIKYKEKGKGGGDLEDVVKSTEKKKGKGKKEKEKENEGLPDLEKFKQIVKMLRGSGDVPLNTVFHQDLIRLWYAENEKIDFKVIPLLKKTGSPLVPLTPQTWVPSKDKIQDLDILQSKQGSPKIIIGRTTKKWEFKAIEGPVKEKPIFPNFLPALDTSGSMEGIKYHVAAYTAYLVSKYAITRGAKVAPCNFSKVAMSHDWTTDIDILATFYATEQQNTTELPADTLLKLNTSSDRHVFNLLITDAEIWNFSDAYPFLEQIMQRPKTKMALFKIGECTDIALANEIIKQLKEINCEVHIIIELRDLKRIALGRVMEEYEETT